MAQMRKVAAKPAKDNLIDKVTKRYNVTAREARDIVTSAMTLAKSVATPERNYGSVRKDKRATIVKAVGNIAKQAGETYTAATKGKSGTTALKLNTMSRFASGMPSDVEYQVGKKRKQGSKN